MVTIIEGNNELNVALVPVAPPVGYEVGVGFKQEPVCAEWLAVEPKPICVRYSPDEREGIIDITNRGTVGRFTTIIECWLYLSGVQHQMFKKLQWTDFFEIGQTRMYTFEYMVPITGMPMDSRFFIKVYDPEGNIVADRVFITAL